MAMFHSYVKLPEGIVPYVGIDVAYPKKIIGYIYIVIFFR